MSAIFCDSDVIEMHKRSLAELDQLLADKARDVNSAINADKWISTRAKLDAIIFARGLKP